MAISEKEYADLCQAAYDGKDGPGNASTTWNVRDTYGAWKVVAQRNTDQADNALDGGFSAVVFQRENPLETVVVFKGTDFKTYGDASADVDLAVSENNPQYRAMQRFLEGNRGSLQGHVTFAGHSLGGNLAMHAALTSGIDATCVTFNAPGFTADYIAAHPNFYSRGGITEYQNRDDIVSSIGQHPGSVVLVEPRPGSGFPNHDLSDLGFTGDTLTRSGSSSKSVLCEVVQGIALFVDATVPGDGALHQVVKGVLWIAYTAAYNLDITFEILAGLLLIAAAPFLIAHALAVVMAALVVVAALAAFALGYWVGLELCEFASWLAEQAKIMAQKIVEAARSIGAAIADAGRSLLVQVSHFVDRMCAEVSDAVSSLWRWLTTGGVHVVQALSANTQILRQGAARLNRAGSRMVTAELRLARLRGLLGPAEWQQWLALCGVDLCFGAIDHVMSCAGYLAGSADRIESAEHEVLGHARQFG